MSYAEEISCWTTGIVLLKMCLLGEWCSHIIQHIKGLAMEGSTWYRFVGPVIRYMSPSGECTSFLGFQKAITPGFKRLQILQKAVTTALLGLQP